MLNNKIKNSYCLLDCNIRYHPYVIAVVFGNNNPWLRPRKIVPFSSTTPGPRSMGIKKNQHEKMTENWKNYLVETFLALQRNSRREGHETEFEKHSSISFFFQG